MEKLLLWDIDGTLIRSKGVGKRALTRAFLQVFGVENAFEGIGMAGGLDAHLFAEAFARHGVALERVDELLKVYYELLPEEVARGVTLAEGVMEILEQAERTEHLYQALGTGNVEMGARIKLEPFGLNRFFPVGGFCEAPVERYEMLAQGVSNASSHYGIDFAPERVIVIGDTLSDITAARQLGARVIAVATGGSTYEELEQAEPDVLLRDLTEKQRFWALIARPWFSNSRA